MNQRHSTTQLPGLTLVLGGTGKTGRRVADRLEAQNVPIRIGSRTGTPAFDWDDRNGWDSALRDVTAVYIAYYPDLAVPGAPADIQAFCDLAVKLGVQRLVLLSGRGEEEAQRCADLLSDPKKTVLIMGNHGVMVIGQTVAETFNRMYYFERAAETYIRALQTGQHLRVLSDEVAEKTAQEIEAYPGQAERHFDELKAILDDEGGEYAR